MTRIACIRAMGAASQGRAGLDEAERLRLEEHLQGCSACAAEASILNGIVHAQRSIGALDAHVRERALAGAFRARSNPSPAARAKASGWKTPVFAMAAIAVGADGLIVEVHPCPEQALSDGDQSLAPAAFDTLMIQLGRFAEAAGRTMHVPIKTAIEAA